MNIDRIELRPADSSDVIYMSFRDPARRNAYHIKDVTGLDAEAITPKYYGGSSFYNLSMDKRDIVMRIQLNPYRDTTTPVGGLERVPIDASPTTYAELRDKLYKLIASSRKGLLELRFWNGLSTIASISGFVTKFEANLFVKEPEVLLTINCQDPLFRGLSPIAFSSSDLTALQAMSPPIVADPLSTAPHGFTFEFRVSGAPLTFKMFDPTDTSWQFELRPLSGFNDNDVIHISSDPANKQLYLVRGSATIYLADVLTPGSLWPILFPGDNHFSITPSNFVWNAVSYYPTYWGV